MIVIVQYFCLLFFISEFLFEQLISVVFMSVKIILSGDAQSINTALTTLRCPPLNEGEEIRIQSVQAGVTEYLLFIVKDISLVVSQVAGAAGLVCLFSQRSIQELKEQTASMISKAAELEGIPLVMAISTNHGKSMSLREMVSQLEQLKAKDRVVLVKEIDVESRSSIEAILSWVASQRVQAGFDAQPRVVKAKAKYREEPEQNKTYESLMRDKKFKAMPSVSQEAQYLAVEKERIKEIGMKEQLARFTRNKEKMTPYDIKPSPNPRIEPNLNFFLKDIHADKPSEVSIKVQTDEFRPRPPSPRYVPKKTGIDCATQIEDNELFDFDREVEPILDVLVVRTLEEAVLGIEEEEEVFKMAKFRELYEYKKREEKSLHREYLLAEESVIRQKEEHLEVRRARHQSKLSVFKKVQAFKVAGQLTSRIYAQTMASLSAMGLAPNELTHQLGTDYFSYLIKQSGTKLQTIQARTEVFEDFFDDEVIKPLLTAADERKKQRLSRIEKASKRRVNKSGNSRVVNLVFNSEPSFNLFALNFSQHFDGTEQQYKKGYNERLKEMEAKMATGEVTEDGVERFKREELASVLKDRTGLVLDSNTSYGFVLAHNQFEPTDAKKQFLSLKIIALDDNGQVVEEVSSIEPSQSQYFAHDKQIRDHKATVSMDEGFSFELAKLGNISAIVFAVKVTDLEKLSKPSFIDSIKHAAYGFETNTNAVPIYGKGIKEFNVLESYKPEEEKQEEGEQKGVKSSSIVPFVLLNNKRLKGWHLQTVNYLSKPMTQEEEGDFVLEIAQYFKACHDQEREGGEQDEAPEQPKERKTSREGKRDRRKSKEEEKKPVVVEDPVEAVAPLVSRMFPAHEVYFNEGEGGYEAVHRLLEQEVNGTEEIAKSYPYGYHFSIRGKPFTALSELKRYRKVGDLTVESNPEPVVESEKLVEEEEAAENENEEAQ